MYIRRSKETEKRSSDHRKYCWLSFFSCQERIERAKRTCPLWFEERSLLYQHCASVEVREGKYHEAVLFAETPYCLSNSRELGAVIIVDQDNAAF